MHHRFLTTLLLIAATTTWSLSETFGSAPQSSEDPPFHLYIDQKRIVEIYDDGYIDFFVGLDSWTYARSSADYANFDLEFDQILLVGFVGSCTPEDSCFMDPDKTLLSDYYLGKYYKYFKAKTFVSFSTVQVGEVTRDNLKIVASLEVRIVVGDDISHSIFGMAPNSVIWPYYNKIYQFAENRIRFQYFNHPQSEFLALYNTNLIKDDIFSKQSIDSDEYTLVSTTVLISEHDSAFWVDHICVSNRDSDVMFLITSKNYKTLLLHFCDDPSKCEFKGDLNVTYQNDLMQISYSDYRNQKHIKNLAINLRDLISFDVDEKIIWRFRPLPEDGPNRKCTMTLEKQFFVKFFLTVILNEAENSAYISLDVLDPDFFFKLSQFSVFCIVMVTASISIVLCYILYSKLFIRRIIQKARNN
jgi:hypothetical protein